MAVYVNRGQHIYCAGYSLAPWMTEATLELGTQSQDKTTLADNTRQYLGGINTAKLSLNGLDDDFGTDESTQDGFDEIFNPVNGTVVENQLYTLCPLGAATQGNACYTIQGTRMNYEKKKVLGEMSQFSWTVDNSGVGAIAGRVLAGNQSAASNSNTSSYNWQALSASQVMYGTLHVTSPATTLVVKIQSDDNSGFTTPTDRITFSTTSTIGAEQKTLSGAVTDTYWRVLWTRAAGTAVFTVVAGIV